MRFLPTPVIQQQPQHQLTPSSNLLVFYLPESVEKPQLENSFSPFGCIENVKTIKSKGKCLGYGFVKFASIDSAIRAERHFTSIPVHLSSFLKVQFARSPESHKLSLLTFSDIPPKFSHAEIIKIFEAFGPICQTNISWSTAGWSGTIRLETPAQAQAAIGALNNWKPPASTRPVVVKLKAMEDSPYGSPINSSKKAFGKPLMPMLSEGSIHLHQTAPKSRVLGSSLNSPGSSPDFRASSASLSVSRKAASEHRLELYQNSAKNFQRQVSPRPLNSQKRGFQDRPSIAPVDKRKMSPQEPKFQKDTFSTWSSNEAREKPSRPSFDQNANSNWSRNSFSVAQNSGPSSCNLQNDVWKPLSYASNGSSVLSGMPPITNTSSFSNSSLVSAQSHSLSKPNGPAVEVISQKSGFGRSISCLFDKPVEPVIPCRFVNCKEERVSLHLLFSSLQLTSNRLGGIQERY